MVSSKKQKTSKTVEVAKRLSSRVAGTRTLIPLRTERRAAMTDSQGIHSNPFAILQNVNNSALSKLAAECGIDLGESEEEIDASIDLIKA